MTKDQGPMPPSYLEQVERFFVAAVRRGLVLRPADVDLAREWERRGVPFDAVRRGIEAGLRDFLASAEPRQPVPSSLRWYRSHVEAEARAHERALAQGRLPVAAVVSPAPARDLAADARAALAARLDETSAEALRAALQAALGRLDARSPGEPLDRLLDALDDDLARAMIGTAPAAVRAGIDARVRAAIDRARAHGLGPAALADAERAETRRAAAELGWTGLVDTLLGEGPG